MFDLPQTCFTPRSTSPLTGEAPVVATPRANWAPLQQVQQIQQTIANTLGEPFVRTRVPSDERSASGPRELTSGFNVSLNEASAKLRLQLQQVELQLSRVASDLSPRSTPVSARISRRSKRLNSASLDAVRESASCKQEGSEPSSPRVGSPEEATSPPEGLATPDNVAPLSAGRSTSSCGTMHECTSASSDGGSPFGERPPSSSAPRGKPSPRNDPDMDSDYEAEGRGPRAEGRGPRAEAEDSDYEAEGRAHRLYEVQSALQAVDALSRQLARFEDRSFVADEASGSRNTGASRGNGDAASCSSRGSETADSPPADDFDGQDQDEGRDGSPAVPRPPGAPRLSFSASL